MVKIIPLTIENIVSELLFDFCHHQVITKTYIHDNNEWKTTDTHILREWSLEKKKWISQYLQQQIERGGFVVAAFDEDILIGFCSIDGCLLGKTAKYANMTMLFVDDRYKRKGIGKKLFFEICSCARLLKADKIFISAIPSVETVNFYFNIGCKDALEIIPEYVDTKQDRYMEFLL